MSDSPADDTLPGYFIAPDAHDDLYVWRENGNLPEPIVGQFMFRDDPAVWNILAAAIRTHHEPASDDLPAAQTSGVATGADEGGGL